MNLKKLFCYAIPDTLVPLGAQVQPQINFTNDADFELVEIRATPQAVNAIMMQLSMANGDLLSNVPVDTSQFSGTSYPIRLPYPVIIPASTQLNVLLINTTGGNLTTAIQLWGYKRPLTGY